MPNTRSTTTRIHIVSGTVVDWILPSTGTCVGKRVMLGVAASSTRQVKSVRFLLDGKQIATAHRTNGIWRATVSTAKTPAGRHTLTAVAASAKGPATSARRIVRVCTR
jgi:hypothetical protein